MQLAAVSCYYCKSIQKWIKTNIHLWHIKLIILNVVFDEFNRLLIYLLRNLLPTSKLTLTRNTLCKQDTIKTLSGRQINKPECSVSSDLCRYAGHFHLNPAAQLVRPHPRPLRCLNSRLNWESEVCYLVTLFNSESELCCFCGQFCAAGVRV